MKAIVIHQTGSVYCLLDNGDLYVTPLLADNIFDFEDGYIVDKELMLDEPLPEPYCNLTTFSQLYKYLEEVLAIKNN